MGPLHVDMGPLNVDEALMSIEFNKLSIFWYIATSGLLAQKKRNIPIYVTWTVTV